MWRVGSNTRWVQLRARGTLPRCRPCTLQPANILRALHASVILYLLQDLDHCPRAVGHESQTQERNDAKANRGWKIGECLPLCVDPLTGKSACEWVNNLSAKWARYAGPFDLGTVSESSLPLDVYVRHIRCRCQPLCSRCHRNLTSYRKRKANVYAAS